MLFLNSSAELAVGFAAVQVPAGETSVRFSGPFPAGAILRACQVDAERTLSLPSEAVIF